jgi:hypothetical protein
MIRLEPCQSRFDTAISRGWYLANIFMFEILDAKVNGAHIAKPSGCLQLEWGRDATFGTDQIDSIAL